MASSKFNKVQVGHQVSFAGGYVAPTIQLPWKGTYEDKRQVHVAEYDSGNWTPTTKAVAVAYETAMTFEGTAFFELLPVMLSSGVLPSQSVAYLHTYDISPLAVTVPIPFCALAGTVGTNIGATGPAVKLINQYLRSITLSANINDKVVMMKAETFGTTFDAGVANAGFAFISPMNVPATMDAINGLRGVIRYEDAVPAGNKFATMSDFDCTILDWEWTFNTGIEPAWCLTDETTTWSTLKYTSPSCTFKPIVRTNATTYEIIKGKADTNTYQEIQLYIGGTVPASDALTINMTGRWDVVPTAHDEQDGEVVMKPTFLVETPQMQTSDYHWMTIKNLSTHNWV